MKTMKKVLGLFISVVVIIWAGIIIYDFIQFKSSKEMKFCLSQETRTYDYGTTYECIGLGYKAYSYDWPTTPKGHYKSSNFGPFFIKENTDPNSI